MMRSLKNVNLNENQLTQLPNKLLCSQLETLLLSKNQISDIDSECLIGLTKLKYLDLNGNNLTSFDSFPLSTQLEVVILSFNKLQ